MTENEVIHGDCIEVMATLDAESIDAIVTDPPYGPEFMGKGWDGADGFRRSMNANDVGRDNVFGRQSQRGPEYRATPLYQSWCEAWAREAYRVAKPGAHLLAFGGTRTYHRLAAAIEDAGWEIRRCLVWAYASGFPKSRNLHGEWQGWGTALKPAWEPIVLARKPLRGTVAANVQAFGTGALNIAATRIGVPMDGRATSPGASGSSGAGSIARIDPWLEDESRAHNPSTLLLAWSAARPAADSAPLANALADAFVGRGVLSSRGGYPSCRRCGDGLARIAEAADRDDAPLRPDVPGAPPLREWSASRIRESRCDDHRATWDELARVVSEGDISAYGNDTTLDVQQGRWPPNLLLTSPIFDGDTPGVVGGGETGPGAFPRTTAQSMFGIGGYSDPLGERLTDSGTYSRFFLIPKADRADREPVLGGLPKREAFVTGGPSTQTYCPACGDSFIRSDGYPSCGHGEREFRPTRNRPRANVHPTVKPTELMRHLVRLVTPPGGLFSTPSSAPAPRRSPASWRASAGSASSARRSTSGSPKRG